MTSRATIEAAPARSTALTITIFQASGAGRLGPPRLDPLNATAPRVVLSNGRGVADPFFNIAYPQARRNDVNMLKADDAHLVNLRIQKSIALPGSRKVEVSADVFNL